MSAWQPIETAPKDGTLVDLWAGGKRCPECFWWAGLTDDDGYWRQRYAEEPRASFTVVGITTHWMPAPRPPSNCAAKGDAMKARHEVDGFPVDLTRPEAEALIANSRKRVIQGMYGRALEIEIDGEWMELARTDLKDDVCTTRPAPPSFSDAAVIEHQVTRYQPRYGARIKRDPSRTRPIFAAIVAWSDG